MNPSDHAQALERRWPQGRTIDVTATLGPLRRGRGDPAHQLDAYGAFWRVFRSPQGAATLALRQAPDALVATAWGSGADWALQSLPKLLGADDDWGSLDLSSQPRLARLLRSLPGLRLARTELVFEALLPAILEQRVTGGEARAAWRSLLYKYGTIAPGPNSALRVPPDAATVLSVPTWDWHRFGVDLQRQRAIRAAATVARRLEECSSLPLEDAMRRLRIVPGIGAWTAAEVAQRAFGHPDAVSVGDYHVHDLVVFALTGEARGDDSRMLEVLEPWLGQRQRIVRLIELSGVRKPRFGPRFSPQDKRAM